MLTHLLSFMTILAWYFIHITRCQCESKRTLHKRYRNKKKKWLGAPLSQSGLTRYGSTACLCIKTMLCRNMKAYCFNVGVFSPGFHDHLLWAPRQSAGEMCVYMTEIERLMNNKEKKTTGQEHWKHIFNSESKEWWANKNYFSTFI